MLLLKQFSKLALSALLFFLVAVPALAQCPPTCVSPPVDVPISITSAASAPVFAQYTNSSASNAGSNGPLGPPFHFTLPNAVIAGGALVCGFSYDGTAALTITDSLGNTWPAATATATGQVNSAAYVLPNPLPGVDTITVNTGVGVTVFSYRCGQLLNVATSSPVNGFRVASSIQPNGSAVIDPGSFTPGNNDASGGNVIWNYTSLASFSANSNPTTWVAGTNFTLLDGDISWTNNQGFPQASQWYVQSTAAAVDPKITSTGDTTDFYNSVTVALKVASSGASVPSGIHINAINHQTSTALNTANPWPLQFPATGNLRVLNFSAGFGTYPVASVVDNDGTCTGGSSWVDANAQGTGFSQFWWAAGCAANPNLKVTVTFASSAVVTISARFYDIQGAAASPLDVAAGTAGVNTSNLTVINDQPVITTTAAAPELVLGIMGLGLGPATGFASGAPAGAIFDVITYGGEGDTGSFDNSDGMGHAYTTSANQTFHWNWNIVSYSSNDVVSSGAVAFKPGAVGPPVISGVALSNGNNFTTPAAPGSTIDTLTAICSSGSCAGATFALATSGSCSSVTNNNLFAISGSNLNIGGGTVTVGTYSIGIAVFVTGATNTGACFPFPNLVGTSPVPTAVNFGSSPATVADTAIAGTQISTVIVTMNPPGSFTGTLSILSTTSTGATPTGAIATPNVVTRGTALSAADDCNFNTTDCTVVVQACENATCVSGTLQLIITAATDPTIGLLPTSRDGYSSWSTAGMQSVGGIPHRTVQFGPTLTPNGTDDTAQINNAIAACSGDKFILLSTGVFRITGQGLVWFGPDHCVLRGSGPGNQLSSGLNNVGVGDDASSGLARSCVGSIIMTVGNASFCVDPTATQLIKFDRAGTPANNKSYEIIHTDSPGQGFGASFNLASDAPQGANSVTLVSAPSPPIAVGEIVQIDVSTYMNTANDDPNVYFSSDFCPCPTGPPCNNPGAGDICPNPPYNWPTFMRAPDRSIQQIMEVTGTSNGGKTITFNTNLHYTFKTINTAQLVRFVNPVQRNIGIEDMFLWGGQGGDDHGNISINRCAYCWIKNVESTWAAGTNIGFYSTFRSELRDSFIHESEDPYPGGGGYLTGLATAASDNLIENNIIWSGNKVITVRGSGGGNVIAYNYMDDAFGGSYPDQGEAGVNAGHFTTPNLELMEGNYSQNYKGDSFWGNSINLTVFRNWLSTQRAAHPPLNTYVFAGSMCYGDYYNRYAVSIQAFSYYHSLVGNVLGYQGQTPITVIPGGCGNEQPQPPYVEQATKSTDATGNLQPIMWQIGAHQTNGQYEAGNSWVDSTITTILRLGNWDWVTGAQQWFALGGITHGGFTPVTIPPSFYKTSKPAFFGTHPWPWVEPTTGVTSGGSGSTSVILPARYCDQQGKMPTCTLP